MMSLKELLAAVCSAAMVMGTVSCSSSSSTSPTSSSAAATRSSSASPAGALDLQAHRGGRGEHTEESATGFGKAMDLGVTTLELDIVMTKDGVPAVWHDPQIAPEKCRDTAAAVPGDKQFPYVGKLVHDLTWKQIQTLRCDKVLKGFPKAQQVKDNRIIQLSDVFALAAKRKASVRYNIETKVEADHRGQSAAPQAFVDAILKQVKAAGVASKVSIESFDWRTLPMVHAQAPDIPTVMLWDNTTWYKNTPWSGKVDYNAVGGDVVKAAHQLGAEALSPGYSVPYGQTPWDKGFRLVADKNMVTRAHKAGLTVIPWTIDDRATMEAQIKAGADGIITDYPTLLRQVMKDRGMTLPKPYPGRS